MQYNTSNVITFLHEIILDTASILSQSVQIYVFVVAVCICIGLSFTSIVTNIINIIIFIKSGFSESTNIILLSLSVSDLGLCLGNLAGNVLQMPFLQTADFPLDPREVVYVTTGVPFILFGRITSWIMVFATLERYLCIARPLKVCYVKALF